MNDGDGDEKEDLLVMREELKEAKEQKTEETASGIDPLRIHCLLLLNL